MGNKGLHALAVVSLSLCVVIASGLYIAFTVKSGAAFDSNIMALMPVSDADSQAAQAGARLQTQGERRFTVLLHSQDPQAAERAAASLRSSLVESSYSSVQKPSTHLLPLLEVYKPYRYQLLSGQQRDYLQNNSAQAIADKTLAALYSPMPAARVYSLKDDPFNLAGDWFSALAAGNVEASQRQVYTDAEGRPWQAVSAELSASPFDLDTQSEILSAIDRLSEPGLQVLSSGIVFHAAEGAKLARKEVSTLAVASVLAIIILVLFSLRSVASLFIVLAVLLASSCVALAVCLLVFERVNLLTLAFGTSLLGIAVDYCFHFLCTQAVSSDAGKAALTVRSSIVFSVISTALAYSLQLLSPFPGLHQFAVFVMAGLLAAAVLVVWVLPVLVARNVVVHRSRVSPALFARRIQPIYFGAAAHRKLMLPGLFLLALVMLGWLLSHGVNDDVRNLNTSSPALIDAEAEAGRILGRSGGQQYFAVSGSKQQRLEYAEHLQQQLASSVDDVALFSLARFIPSEKQQAEDFALLMEKLYSSEGAAAQICARSTQLCPLYSTKPEFKPGLNPDTLSADLSAALGLDVFRGEGFDLIVPSRALPSAVAESLAAGNNDIHFQDQVAAISDTLSKLRQQTGYLIASFIGLLSLVSFALFRSRGLVVVIPLIVSVLAGLAMAAVGGLTLFHMLAVLLVMGLSVDASVFYLKLGFASEVWLAVSLSTLTSMLAFGLLAFSEVAVLNQFGSVVFTGLLVAWLSTPLVYSMVAGTERATE